MPTTPGKDAIHLLWGDLQLPCDLDGGRTMPDLLLQAAGVLILSALAPLAFARPRAWLLQAIGSGTRDRTSARDGWAGSE